MTEIVRDGYDRIADTFAAWRDRIEGDPRDDWRDELLNRLPAGARVLELGCGSGDDLRALAQRFAVTGVDVSAEQIERARANVPGGVLLTAFGVSDTEAWTGDWRGATMFFSSFPPETNTRLIRDAGFDLLRDELVTFREPEGEATFQWVLARST